MHIKNEGNHLYISRAICVLVVFSPFEQLVVKF